MKLFANRPQAVLLAFPAFALACGVATMCWTGIRSESLEEVHGVRLAFAILLCGVFAGRLHRHRTLAMVGIDSAVIVLAAAGLNYGRLTWKWASAAGDMPLGRLLPVAFLGLGALVSCMLLIACRPAAPPAGRSWWRWSPLLILPLAAAGLARRRRHGLGFLRRATLTAGVLMLAAGFVLSNHDRLPRSARAAALLSTVERAQEHGALIEQVLEDPGRIRDLLDDPQAKAALKELAAEEGLLEDTELRTAVKRLAEGEVDAVADLVTPQNLALLADVDVDRVLEAVASLDIDVPIGSVDLAQIDRNDPRVRDALRQLQSNPDAMRALAPHVERSENRRGAPVRSGNRSAAADIAAAQRAASRIPVRNSTRIDTKESSRPIRPLVGGRASPAASRISNPGAPASADERARRGQPPALSAARAITPTAPRVEPSDAPPESGAPALDPPASEEPTPPAPAPSRRPAIRNAGDVPSYAIAADTSAPATGLGAELQRLASFAGLVFTAAGILAIAVALARRS